MICRLCLIDLNLEISVPLFNDFGNNDEPELVKIILKYLHIDITSADEISTAICHECSKHLKEFDKYCACVRKQQILLSQRVLVDQVNAEKSIDATLSVEPMELQVKCESEGLTMETQLKCEPEETVLTEMAVISGAGSNYPTSSSYSDLSSSSFFHEANTSGSAQIFNPQCIDDSSSSLDNHVYTLPDANTIRLLQPLQKIYKNYSIRKSLENKDRLRIAKAVIDECLKHAPAKLLHREEFEKLAKSIKEVFPSEFVSMYYIPSIRHQQVGGKLYNAYNNKRNTLKASGEMNMYVSTDVTPDASQIKLLRPLQQIYRKFQLGKPLQNKDRILIARAVINACLEDNPDKILKREYFHKLTANIIEVFPTETAESYFMPSIKTLPARGKLWCSYNNKRNGLRQEGIIKRRPRLQPSKEGCISPPLQVADVSEIQTLEYIQCLEENTLDWSNIWSKWIQTHEYRNKKLKATMSTREYITKFPALQGDKGIELVSYDVQMLYKIVASAENWLQLYEKLLNRARSVRDSMVIQLISEIDASTDERFRAGLTLLFIPYMFSRSGKRSESSSKLATKSDIQQRFIKKYNSLSELYADEENIDLQIKFVKENGAITYAEFSIAGYKFQCADIIEALNLGFMYMTALNVAYPKLCMHVWQFVQLAIFKIDLSFIKVSSLETIVNDIFNKI